MIDHGKTNTLLSQGMFENNEKFIILERLGSSLNKIFSQNHKNMRKIDVLKLGISMLKLVKNLHSIGFLHLDIKANNLLFGANE